MKPWNSRQSKTRGARALANAQVRWRASEATLRSRRPPAATGRGSRTEAPVARPEWHAKQGGRQAGNPAGGRLGLRRRRCWGVCEQGGKWTGTGRAALPAHRLGVQGERCAVGPSSRDDATGTREQEPHLRLGGFGVPASSDHKSQMSQACFPDFHSTCVTHSIAGGEWQGLAHRHPRMQFFICKLVCLRRGGGKSSPIIISIPIIEIRTTRDVPSEK